MLQKKSRDINFTTKAAAEPAFKLFPAFWEVLISKLFRILFSPCAVCLFAARTALTCGNNRKYYYLALIIQRLKPYIHYILVGTIHAAAAAAAHTLQFISNDFQNSCTEIGFAQSTVPTFHPKHNASLML